ncbi:MAG: hypothetical protein ABFC78_07410 [Methanoregula sp.]
MTVSVSNDDDDEAAKRLAFFRSFVMTHCNYPVAAVRECIDHAFALSMLSVRDPASSGRSVPGLPDPRVASLRVERELIC